MPRKTEPAGFDGNARISIETLSVTNNYVLVSKRVHMPPIARHSFYWMAWPRRQTKTALEMRRFCAHIEQSDINM